MSTIDYFGLRKKRNDEFLLSVLKYNFKGIKKPRTRRSIEPSTSKPLTPVTA